MKERTHYGGKDWGEYPPQWTARKDATEETGELSATEQIRFAVERLSLYERALQRKGIPSEQREVYNGLLDAAVRTLAHQVLRLVYLRNIPLPVRIFDD